MKLITVLVGALLAFIGISCRHAPEPFDEAAWRRQVENQTVADLYAPHFRDGRFFNPWAPMEKKSLVSLLKWQLTPAGPYSETERNYLPAVVPGLIDRIRNGPPGDLIAWIGHSTFLLRLQGEYWLTDPIFSHRALIPGRYTPPAISAEDLEGLGAPINVIISHNHYDHLDVESIKALPAGSRVYAPLGLGSYLESIHDGNVQELDWWDEIDAGGTRLVCLPAQHWSRRIGQGFNTTLWASFMLIGSETTLYYGADSGYFVGFREFGQRFPGIDYALLSTTAYHPRWFMHYAHANIPETIDAFHDLGAKYVIPTQWGTFSLGNEPAGYPALDLKRHIKTRRLDPSRFIILEIGGMRRVEKTETWEADADS